MQEIKHSDDKEQVLEKNITLVDTENDMDILLADKFWSDTFNEIPTYEVDEAMLAEIFNYNEADFLFDIALNDDVREKVEEMLGGKLNELSVDEKIERLQQMSDKISEILDLEDRPIVAYYTGNEGDYGFYQYEDNTINLNSFYFDSSESVVKTLVHELRHVFQYQRAQLCENYLDVLYRCNYDNYISPVPLADGNYLFFTDYQDQLVEAEARAYAKSFMEAI